MQLDQAFGPIDSSFFGSKAIVQAVNLRTSLIGRPGWLEIRDADFSGLLWLFIHPI